MGKGIYLLLNQYGAVWLAAVWLAAAWLAAEYKQILNPNKPHTMNKKTESKVLTDASKINDHVKNGWRLISADKHEESVNGAVTKSEIRYTMERDRTLTLSERMDEWVGRMQNIGGIGGTGVNSLMAECPVPLIVTEMDFRRDTSNYSGVVHDPSTEITFTIKAII